MAAEAVANQLDQLKQLVPLNLLPEKELTQLLEQTDVETLKKGEYLFKAGDTEAKNVYLLTGKVDLLSGRKIVDTIEMGTEAASFALAHRLPRELACRAKTKVECIRIDSRKLGEMVENTRQDAFKVDDFEAEAGDDWMSQLLSSRVFQHIPPGNIQSVMIRMQEVEVKADEHIVIQGEEGDYFYMINKGECSVTRTLPNSSETVELARLGPGDSFGEEALISDKPRGGSITMLTDGVLLRLSKEDFVELVKAPMARLTSYEDAKTLVDGGGVWLDVRSPEEYKSFHLPGAINMPLNTLRFESSALDLAKRHVVYCDDGGQSSVAAFLLTEHGFEVYTLENGIKAVPDEVRNPTQDEESQGDKVVELRPGGQASAEAKKLIEALKAKNKKMEAEVKSLQIRLVEAEQTAKRSMVDAEQALELWEERLGELESERKERDAKLSDLKKLRDEQAAKIKGLLGMQTSMENELREATEQLEKQLYADETRAIQLGELEEIRSALESELSEAKAKLVDQGVVDEQLAAVRKEAEERQAKLTELEKAREEQATQLTELESARSALETELNDAKAQMADQGAVDEQLETARKEAAEAQAEFETKLAELEKAREEQATQLTELESARSALETELNDAKAQMAGQGGAEERLAAVRAEATERQAELEGLMSEMGQTKESLESELSEVKNRCVELEAQVDRLQQAPSEQTADSEELQALRVQLEELRTQKEELETGGEEEIGMLRAEMDLARAEAEDKISTLEAELLEVRVATPEVSSDSESDAMDQEVLRQELEDTKRALGQRQQEIERVLSQQQNLDDTLEDRSAQLEKLAQELEQAKAESQELETKYREAEEERLQAETALTVMQERVEQEVADTSSPEPAPVQQVVDGGFSKKSGVMGMAAGVLMGVLILDAFMILSGRGEIITGMMGGDAPRTVALTPAPEVKPEPQSQVVKAEPVQPGAGSVVEAETTAKAAPTKKAASKKPEAFSSAIGRELQERLASGGVGPKMVRLPSGKFEMGSSRSLIASNERPAHEVSLGSFYMGRYEVTFAEYDRFAKATGRGLPDDKGWGRGKRPVINVSWEDAAAYAQWLSKQSGAVYRLPTEAEWEYAAAGGADSLFWWGYDIGENQANCFNCGGKWAGKQTAPVDSFKPNPYGIHNTAGNVMEWVQDCYHPNYEGAPTDGSAWSSFDCRERVARGGAYSKPGESMRATKRSRQTPASKLPILGFRLVREK